MMGLAGNSLSMVTLHDLDTMQSSHTAHPRLSVMEEAHGRLSELCPACRHSVDLLGSSVGVVSGEIS
jgi:hypothetical protein